MLANATILPSPVGDLLGLADRKSGALTHLLFCDRDPIERAEAEAGDRVVFDPVPFAAVAQQLGQYFAGSRREFDLHLDPRGTGFQRQVWTELARIPWGATISYGELADRIDNPRAVRAVGRANGRNPISIILPCHRVIGADGTLTGYGGGLPRKRLLLELEGSVPAERQLELRA